MEKVEKLEIKKPIKKPIKAVQLIEELEEPEHNKSMGICAVWDFRANEDYFTSSKLENFLKSNCKKYAFQKEKGDENGYIHWQGRFSLIKKRNISCVKKMFMASLDKIPNYLKPTVKANHQDDFFYCMKEDTRLEGPWVDSNHKASHIEYMPRQYRDIKKLYPYQQAIKDSLQVFDFRTVNVLIDKRGENGKTTISALMELLDNCYDMPVLNDFDKIINTLCDICIGSSNRSPAGVFFDMPRATNKEGLAPFFSAVEQIKKGKLFDVRYRYRSYWIDSPVIWVFTNAVPDEDLLSRDRWKLWALNDDKELVPYVPKDVIKIFGSVSSSSDDKEEKLYAHQRFRKAFPHAEVRW